MNYHAGVVTKAGEIKGKAFESREEAEAWILDLAEREGIKQGRVRDLRTGETDIIDF